MSTALVTIFSTSLAQSVSVLVKAGQVHRDPFDRLLVAQAILERLTLLTADGTLNGRFVRLV